MRKVLRCAAALLLSCALTGCSAVPGFRELQETVNQLNPLQADSRTEETYTVDCPNTYYYDMLTEEQQGIYASLLEGSDTYSRKIQFRHDVAQEDLDIAMEAYKREHPEAYWTQAYTMYTYGGSDAIREIEYSDDSDYETISGEIRAAAQEVLNGVPSDYGTYSTLQYFYDWIIDHTAYQVGCEDSQNVRSVFLNHVSVCSGYSEAFQYLCNEAGIPCAVVKGSANGGAHAWNVVWISDTPYWIDVTWGDPVFEADSSIQMKNYDYFCVDDELLTASHTPSADVDAGDEILADALPYPVCSDRSLDYYVISGMYFETYDRETVQQYIYGYLREGITENISFRLGSQAVFVQAYQDLFTGGNYIEDILLGWYTSSLHYSYSGNEDARVITISVFPE